MTEYINPQEFPFRTRICMLLGIDPLSTDDEVCAAIATAHTAGQREMRERLAESVDQPGWIAGTDMAKMIRAFPLTEPK